MTNTPIDRESVERAWASPMLASLLEQMANQPSALDSYVIASGASMAITEIRALRAALDAAEAELAARPVIRCGCCGNCDR